MFRNSPVSAQNYFRIVYKNKLLFNNNSNNTLQNYTALASTTGYGAEKDRASVSYCNACVK